MCTIIVLLVIIGFMAVRPTDNKKLTNTNANCVSNNRENAPEFISHAYISLFLSSQKKETMLMIAIHIFHKN
jgi:hypothetical protein